MPAALERDWDLIKQDYEAQKKTVEAICIEYDVSPPTLYAHAGRGGWIGRQTAKNTGRPALIERLAKMLERQIAHLEKNMTPGDEKEVVLLGKMAQTLEKLIDLDRKEKPVKPDAKRDREMADIKRKLVTRIDQLRKG